MNVPTIIRPNDIGVCEETTSFSLNNKLHIRKVENENLKPLIRRKRLLVEQSPCVTQQYIENFGMLMHRTHSPFLPHPLHYIIDPAVTKCNERSMVELQKRKG
jgi:hypothetical protein